MQSEEYFMSYVKQNFEYRKLMKEFTLLYNVSNQRAAIFKFNSESDFRTEIISKNSRSVYSGSIFDALLTWNRGKQTLPHS